MKIILTMEQQDKLLRWAGENSAVECEADMEPSGYRLEISVSAYGVVAEAAWVARRIDLGAVELVVS